MSPSDLDADGLTTALLGHDEAIISSGLLDRLASAYVVSWIGGMRRFHGGDLPSLMVIAYLLTTPAPPGGFSADAIATALGLSRRSVLPRLNGLVEAGVLERRDDGLRLGFAYFRSPAALEVRRAVAALTRAFVAELLDHDPSGPLRARLDLPAAEDSAVFLASALLSLNLLRGMVPWTEGDVMLGIVFLAVRDANTRHLQWDEVEAYLESGPGIPDEARRPATAAAVAQRLGVSRASVNRCVRRQVETGSCRAVEGGFLANEDIFETAAARAAERRNRHYVRRFLSVIATHARIPRPR